MDACQLAETVKATYLALLAACFSEGSERNWGCLLPYCFSKVSTNAGTFAAKPPTALRKMSPIAFMLQTISETILSPGYQPDCHPSIIHHFLAFNGQIPTCSSAILLPCLLLLDERRAASVSTDDHSMEQCLRQGQARASDQGQIR